MPLKLAVPLEKEYTLDKTDKQFGVPDGEPTRITIHQATQGEHERRAAIFAQVVREWAKDTSQEEVVRTIQRFSFEELKRIEVRLTMKSCNMLGYDGKQLFKFNADGKIDDDSFKQAWDLLPPSVAEEMHEKVLDLNVDWQPVLGE